MMSIKLQLPKLTDVRPRLTVIGVGGAGCNAVNNMIASGLTGVDFVVANTDAQALASSAAEHRLQLGVSLTEGLGAGSRPEIGEAAAEEAIEDIRAHVAGSHMVFIAAGMGGGTGTGAAAVIARAAKELGILTIGVVTKPFLFEGARRMRIAEAGVAEIKNYVDTLIVIPNQNLFRIASEKTTFAEAFLMADQVLYSGIACIVDLIIKEGLINLDFADVRTVMSGMGTAMMGTGEASGEGRAMHAAEEAIANPLLDDVSLRGARGLLLSISGGPSLTLYEVDEAASRVRQEVDVDANIIVGATFDENLGDRVRVSIVASGMARTGEQQRPAQAEAEAWLRNAKAATATGAALGPNVAAPRPEAHQGDAEIERRLTEALQFRAGAPSHVAREPAPGAHDGPPAGGATWRAPGNVVIEEGPPQLPAAAHMPPPLPPGFGAGSYADSFSAAAPAEIRRPARRMPELQDFPPIGQRAYRALVGDASDAAAYSAIAEQRSRYEPPRRVGFLERITGRRRRDSEALNRDQDSSGDRTTAHDQSSAGHWSGHRADGGARQGQGPAQTDEAPEVPMFFSRERK